MRKIHNLRYIQAIEVAPKVKRQPARPHYLAEWAASLGLRKVDIVKLTGADKGLVSRWYKGTSPGVEYQEKLAAVFGIEPAALFMHPDDHWFRNFVQNRTQEEIEHIKKSMEATFPRK